MDCTSEDCKNTRKILKNGEAVPPKEDPVHFPEPHVWKFRRVLCSSWWCFWFVYGASISPKSRETRAPLVEELVRFKDRISPKFQYLASAPAADPDGKPAEVQALVVWPKKTMFELK